MQMVKVVARWDRSRCLQVVVPELGTSSAWEHSWEQSGNNKDFHGLFSVVFDVPMFHQVVDNKRVSRTFKALVLGSSPSPLTTSPFPYSRHNSPPP